MRKGEENMEPKLVIPQLQPFYRCAEPLSWALIRITAGPVSYTHLTLPTKA